MVERSYSTGYKHSTLINPSEHDVDISIFIRQFILISCKIDRKEERERKEERKKEGTYREMYCAIHDQDK